MSNEEEAVNAFVNEMPFFKDISAVFLYGSFARGDYSNRHSDIDLLILSCKRKVPALLKEKVERAASRINAEYKVRLHPEYQGLLIGKQDRTLMRKIMEEGELLYSSGMLLLGADSFGLKAFYLFEFHVGLRLMQVRLSQILHGRKSWYYHNGRKVVKSYPGLIDDKDVISIGNGRILVSREKRKSIERIFDNFGIEYKIKKIVYSV